MPGLATGLSTGTSAAGPSRWAIVLGAVALIGAGIRFLRRGNPVDGSSNR